MARPMTTAATSLCPRSVVRNASHSATVDAPIAMTTEIEGGVRCEGSDQNGQCDEIRIVCSGNDHRDRPNSDQRPTGDESADSPANAAGNVVGGVTKGRCWPTFPR